MEIRWKPDIFGVKFTLPKLSEGLKLDVLITVETTKKLH